MSADEQVGGRIEEWKSRLIDLSLKNRLLHFQPSLRGALEIIQPGFPSLLDDFFSGSIFPLVPALPEHPVPRGKRWVVRGKESEVHKTATNLWSRSRAALREQGTNILFCFAGLLEWSEPGNSQQILSPLLLVPTVFQKKNTRHFPFSMEFSPEETTVNQALKEKLKSLGIELFPGEDPEFSDGETMLQWLVELERAIHEKSLSWQVRRGSSLALFHFTRLPMFQDLERRKKLCVAHPLIRFLCDVGELESNGETPADPNALDPMEAFQVLDADSSQQQAIEMVKAGRNLVIQGPPGTGKSQTIANIISESLAQGKKVLFVSGKMAALQVVKSRLDGVGLSDFVLEIHDPNRKRSHIVAELADTWKKLNEGYPVITDREMANTKAQSEQIVLLRETLNKYLQRLCFPIQPSHWSVYEMVGKLARMVPLPRILNVSLEPFFCLEKVAHAQVVESLEKIRSFVQGEKGGEELFLRLFSHPWGQFSGSVPPTNAVSQLESRLEKLNTSLSELLGCFSREYPRMGLQSPSTWSDAKRFVRFLEVFDPGILETDLQEWQQRFSGYAGSGLYWLNPFFYRDLRRIKPFFLGDSWPPGNEVLAGWMEEGRWMKAHRMDSAPIAVGEAHREKIARQRGLLESWEKQWSENGKGLLDGGAVQHVPLQQLQQILRERAATLEDAPFFFRLRGILQQASEKGLDPFLREFVESQQPPGNLGRGFFATFFVQLLQHSVKREDILRTFVQGDMEQKLQVFRKLDAEWPDKTGLRLLRRVVSSRKSARGSAEVLQGSEPQILGAEDRKKGRHKPLRRLFSEIPNLLLDLKPCMMMSPLSVSTLLGSMEVEFDLVVFDEASQIPPEDAIGAISRAKKIVVVGDSKQLPPTQFFQKIVELEEWEEAAQKQESAPSAGIPILESILDECEIRNFPQSVLRWHYRSKHEALISFSNEQFYGDSLLTFPGCVKGGSGEGVEHVLVPQGVYERGTTRTNPVEAQAVARWVVDFAARNPENGVSLGVVAFSVAQQEAIEEAIEREVSQAGQPFASFFAENKVEYFFVKNLETVQGDERDVILFSVGYAPDSAGKFPMFFGPLNLPGGEKRLNVAITRARRKVVVFSSFSPSQMDLGGSQSRGVRLLKEYLEYVSGKGNMAKSKGGLAPRSDFEEAVQSALEEKGLQVDPQVGRSRYRVDLGIVHPDDPDRYILGIECDGSLYQPGVSTRDRERLRQQVLEGLGWNLHRAWSLSWNENSDQQVQRIAELVQELQEKGPVPPPATGRVPDISAEADLQVPEPVGEKQVLAYEVLPISPGPSSSEHRDFPVLLRKEIRRVLESEAPVHRKFLWERFVPFFGLSRRSSSVSDGVNRALDELVSSGKYAQRGEFFWKQGQHVPPLRKPEEAKRLPIEWVCDEELQANMLWLLSQAFSLSAKDLKDQLAQWWGYSRYSSSLDERFDPLIEELVRAKKVRRNRNGLLEVSFCPTDTP